VLPHTIRAAFALLLVGFGATTASAAPWPGVGRASGRAAPTVSTARVRDLPGVMLWAWEQPQDLSFIDPGRTGVAFLAATLALEGERVRVTTRRQPLRVPPGTRLIAVGRVEIGRAPPPTLDASQRRWLVHELTALADRPGVSGIQVDFDAPRSARPFYRALLADLRHALPASATLSMTALASWCARDPWVSDLPVDETVPMLFRMGADDHAIRRDLALRGAPACPSCRGAVGLATDEPPPAKAERVYFFHPGPWTPEALDRALAALETLR
jgi:hypothetical protein